MSNVRFKVAPVWKGDYDSSVVYNISDEVRDPNGTGNYRSLINENNQPLENTAAWVNILDLTELKETVDDSKEVNQTIKNNESLRISNENTRKTNESNRVSSEDIRVSNETLRNRNEVNRQDAESSRRTAESSRTSAENTRIANENARKSSETARQSSESTRVSAENTRNTNENARVSSENTRTQSETTRVQNETTRQTNEQTRQTNEQTRQTNEGLPTDEPNPSGSRWARYKNAEDGRNLTFNNNEGAATDTPSATGTRWARFKKGDADRENTFVENEGTPEDEASETGSRWARYKKAEESRSAAITDLQQNKADKEGEFPKLIAGAARNIATDDYIEEEFISRTSGGEAEIATGLAQLEGVKGNSVKFNQLVQNGNFADGANGWTAANGTISVSDGILEYTVTTAVGGSAQYQGRMKNQPCIENHKYYFSYKLKCDKDTVFYNGGVVASGGVFEYRGNGSWQRFCKIFNSTITTANGNLYVSLSRYSDNSSIEVGDKFYLRDVVRIDLTAIFGTDAQIAAALGITEAQITTNLGVAAFESWLERTVGKQPYYAYNPGEVINVNMTGLESVSRNLLDSNGDAQILGTYSDVYESYYGITGTHGAITFTNNNGETSTVTPDSEGKFLLEEAGTLHVATPGEDCSVFIWWDGSKTDYSEHNVDVAKLDVTHIYDEGELVQVFPYGMCCIGDVKDSLEVIDGTPTAIKYIGKRAYASGDESDSDVITDGTNTYYILDTPETYTELVYQGSSLYPDGTLVTLPVNYEVDNWGIENILPKNTLAVNTAMPTITSKYSTDIIETSKTLDDKINAKPNTNGSYPNMSVGAADKLNGVNPIDSEFVVRKTGYPNVVSTGLARITEVRGKSLVWNQLYNNSEPTLTSGHKYYFSEDVEGTKTRAIGTSYTYTEGSTQRQCIDLTLMFGAGNEPTTVEEFEAIYNDYHDYNPGEIVNNATESIETIGFNQWDEEWELGTLDTTTGDEKIKSDQIRAKKYIPVLPSTTYYCRCDFGVWLALFDCNKNIIALDNWTGSVVTSGNMRNVVDDKTFTTSANAAYARFYTVKGYGATYNHDICINISDTVKNGTYEPYKRNLLPLNLTTITGKSATSEESEVIFPEGLRSAGEAYDTLVVDDDGYARKAIVRCDKRAYKSGDESDSTVITDRTNTVYALATPIEYTLDTPIYMGYQAYGDGVERRLPEDTQAKVTAPFVGKIIYPINAVKQLLKMPQDYDTVGSLDNLISALATTLSQILNGTLSIIRGEFDSVTNKYAFTVTFVPNE